MNVVLAEDGKTMVAVRRSLQNIGKCLYTLVYHHDSAMKEPIVRYPKWEETQARAMSYINEENLQEHIVLGEDIQELVKSSK